MDPQNNTQAQPPVIPPQAPVTGHPIIFKCAVCGSEGEKVLCDTDKMIRDEKCLKCGQCMSKCVCRREE